MQGSIRSLQLGQEYSQPNEEAMFKEMGEIVEKLMIRTRSPVQRQQHAKHHGCVRATFEVEQNLPDELRIGLFKDVTSYPAWVRFSNASQHIDTIGNPHGFAVKLMGVKGAKALSEGYDHETQDFLMVDYPTFIVPTASLSFTPWHTLAEHRPLGGINRIRRSAYRASSAVRHQLNGVAEKEPISGTV